MLPVIEQLLVLQDRDRKRLRLEAELTDLPLQRRRLQDKAAQMAAAADSLKHRTRHLESERKKLELEVSSKEEFIRKFETAQGQTKSNDEYKRYAHQIETTKAEIRALEDQELELMEATEVAARELVAAQATATAEKGAVDRQIAELTTREGNLQRDLEGVLGNREELAAAIEPSVLSKYERLLATRGDNIVVGVAGATCGGCHMKLPQQNFLFAKAQKELAVCPNCNRILYYTRDMEP
jgi:predicted  nucleic acid-binding Zn-ribbon protein